MQVWEARREVYNIIFKRGFRFFLRRFSGKHPNAAMKNIFPIKNHVGRRTCADGFFVFIGQIAVTLIYDKTS